MPLVSMVTLKKVRLQAYVEPELAQQITEAARAGHRPESWELVQLLRLGLEAKKAGTTPTDDMSV